MPFYYKPSVEVLQALVQDYLHKETMLAKALRIGVILTTLYGEESNIFCL